MKKFYIVNHFSVYKNAELTSSFDYIKNNNFNNFSYEHYELLNKESLIGSYISFHDAIENINNQCIKNISSAIIREYSLSEEDMSNIIRYSNSYIDISPTNIWYFIKNESLGTMREVFKKETRIYA